MDHCIFRFLAKSFPALGLVAVIGYLSLASLTTSLAFSEVPNSARQEDFWQYTYVPTGRAEHLAVWTGTELIVFAGYNVVSPTTSPPSNPADAARYNPLLDKWTRLNQTNAPGPRQVATAVWTGSEMIVWGGYGDKYLNTGARYRPTTDTWTLVSSNGAPSGRGYHTAIWTGTEMLIWGGTEAPTGTNQLAATGAAYNPVTDTWRSISNQGAPARRSLHIAVWTGSEMLVWGGTYRESPGGTHPSEVRAFSYSNGGRFDPVSGTWTRFGASQTVTPRYAHTAVWTGDEMLIWGGFAGLHDGGRYNPVTHELTPVEQTTLAGRYSHSAVWTGREMIVWGGWDISNVVFRDGARYDPQQNRWTPVSIGGAPGGRWAHSAVWTGREMLIWGGSFYGPPVEVLNSGGRYDPESDSWRLINTNGAPSPRVFHNAVWIGREMIVWGGLERFGAEAAFLQDGARYDPITNTWTPISTNGAPFARSSATAVWTGKEMIVWGGETWGSRVSVFGDGGAYDPLEDKWRAISNVGAPAARAHHTAVWTGREMIIWGGTQFNFADGPLADGARYDPAADRWLPVNQVGAPDGRYSHTAVWTGTGMVIAGGVNHDSAPQDAILIYNPTLPGLSITSADKTSAIVQWPFPTTGFRPQKTDDVSRPDWVDIQGEFTRHGANWLLNVNPTNRAFFRLSLPEHNSP